MTRAEFESQQDLLPRIFRDKHILISDQYPARYKFDAAGLDTVSLLDTPIHIQGMYFSSYHLQLQSLSRPLRSMSRSKPR